MGSKTDTETKNKNDNDKAAGQNSVDKSRANSGIKNSDRVADDKTDWAKIKADYITSRVTAAEISEKYGVAVSSVRFHCRTEKWGVLRKKMQDKAADKIANELNSKNVKETVKEIDRVVKVAGKLITKLNRAVNELDRKEQIIRKLTEAEVKTDVNDNGDEVVVTDQRLKIEREKYKTLVDTKKAEQISKSLLNIKEILTDYSAIQSEDESVGIVEIPQQTVLIPPVEQELANAE